MGCKSSKPAFNPKKHKYQFDMIVIGGGSGGLACAREAAKYGAKVALCDFVLPTPAGAQWGLGGTCVNVGCIPKRLMHQANLVRDFINDAEYFGWENGSFENITMNWKSLIDGIQDYIFSLNFGYRLLLNNERIAYYNGYAQFTDEHTIKLTYPDDTNESLTGQCIVIAVGSRPKYLTIPGGTADDKLCITSDDLFSLPYPPGKTLCIGAGYISMECAGFLTGFGFDVSVMSRSVILRGFDETVVDLLTSNLESRKVKIIKASHPLSITRLKHRDPPRIKVTYECLESRVEHNDEYDTVLIAIGRKPCTSYLNLQVIPNIKIDEDGYIFTNDLECTGVPHIFAIGDCAKGRPQLTPTAIRAGHWLARRIYDKTFDKIVNYNFVPTAIFTPIEYGCCGLSEHDAIAKYGTESVEVYHKSAVPLEFSMNKRDGEAIYAKLVCVRVKKKREKVVGFHYFGPNAGDITQGFSIAVRRQPFKEEFNDLMAIHPTCAEIFTEMNVSKGSKLAYVQKQC